MRRRLLPVLLVSGALVGCGNERTPPPNIDTPEAPAGLKDVDLDRAGVSFQAPANWLPVVPVGSLVGGVKSKTASVNVWRYTRQEPLPDSRVELEAARDRLIERVKAADPSLELERRKLRRHGIELVGTQTIAGVAVGIRSVHLFKRGAEIVIDAYAPPADFPRVDETVFKPLLKTLKVK